MARSADPADRVGPAAGDVPADNHEVTRCPTPDAAATCSARLLFLALAVLPACPKIGRPPDARPAAVPLPRGPIISRPPDVDVPTNPDSALRPAEFVIS